MKKAYVTPVVEKVIFDYKIQTAGTSNCIESIINIRVGENECGEGTPMSFGWTNPQTVVGGN